MKLTLGFSPCPNDTFIFDALVHKKIDTNGINFSIKMADVEELNNMAFENALDVTKLSYHAYAHLTEKYVLLNAGSALGFNCGPMIIAREKDLKISENTHVAIPGKHTTANFLFSLAFPNAKNKKEMLFSEIEKAVINEEVDAGLIIHENRFTYQEKGLSKIIDLGEWWQDQTTSPIPLGGIVMQRKHSDDLIRTVNNLIAESVQFAFNNPSSSKKYVKENAQEMHEDVIKQHIDLYVNKYSINLGNDGKKAIAKLFLKGRELGLFDYSDNELFM